MPQCYPQIEHNFYFSSKWSYKLEVHCILAWYYMFYIKYRKHIKLDVWPTEFQWFHNTKHLLRLILETPLLKWTKACLPCWTRTWWKGCCRTRRSASQWESSGASSGFLLRLLSSTLDQRLGKPPETNSELLKLLSAHGDISDTCSNSSVPCWVCRPLQFFHYRCVWMSGDELRLSDGIPKAG